MIEVDKKVKKVFKDYEKIISIQQEIINKNEDTNRILLQGKMFQEEINYCLSKACSKYELLIKYHKKNREPINIKSLICNALDEYETRKKNNAVSKALKAFLSEENVANKQPPKSKSKRKTTGNVVQLSKRRNKKK